MGEIVGAGLISHAPTIMFDEATRLEINEGKEISLVPGLQRLRSEVFDRFQPDIDRDRRLPLVLHRRAHPLRP